jgi:oxygen-independent coproporphyrinogen-3 oxidase
MLSTVKGISLPYGALTGIRPTKLAYAEQAAGRDFVELFKQLDVREDNIRLVKRVIDEQREVYADRGGQDLFVSLPFCPSKCEYCSFITAPISATKQYVDDYVACLAKELESVAPLLKNPKSIYIGGGTPFAISAEQLERVYIAINKLNLPKIEYTVEAGRPDVFSQDKLQLSKDYGVTRICINPQSFSDKTLVAIGRKHTEKDVYAAFEMSEKFGFDVNLDLIAGLSGESVEDFELSLKKAIELAPANITVHTLSLKSGAKLKEKNSRLHIDGIEKMIDISRKILTEAGYEPYYMYRQKYQAGGHENCGWTIKGKACVYNIDVMEEISDNIAVGANAISKRLFSQDERIERCASPKDIKTYIQKLDKIIEERNKLFE